MKLRGIANEMSDRTRDFRFCILKHYKSFLFAQQRVELWIVAESNSKKKTGSTLVGLEIIFFLRATFKKKLFARAWKSKRAFCHCLRNRQRTLQELWIQRWFSPLAIQGASIKRVWPWVRPRQLMSTLNILIYNHALSSPPTVSIN